MIGLPLQVTMRQRVTQRLPVVIDRGPGVRRYFFVSFWRGTNHMRTRAQLLALEGRGYP